MNFVTPTTLYNKNFITYLIALEISMISNAILLFALPLYVLIYTGNPTLMGTILTISAIPQVLSAPIGGILGDRFSKRNLIASVNIIASIITLVYLLIANLFSFLPVIVLLFLLIEGTQAFVSPSQEATIPAIVPEKYLMKANSINFMLSIFSGVGSPIIAGFIMERHGIKPVLIIAIGLFFLAGIIYSTVKIPFTKQMYSSRNILRTLFDDLRAGLTFTMKESNTHRKVIIGLTLYNMILWPILGILLPVVITNYFYFGESVNGIIRGVIVFGASFGVILGDKLGERLHAGVLRRITFYTAYAIIPAILSFFLLGNHVFTLLIFVISLFVMWVLFTLYVLIVYTYVGMQTPPEYMTKAFAILSSSML